ncbi:hypothetical protein TNCV_3438331 [Trichonephila clavipes]|nr:hypothetical protein TNCV_3438331 [Trichonephila clavipes]
MKAGKYLGKHLLSAGSKVVSDVAAGASLKDSTKSRFRETTKKIKDDILHKKSRLVQDDTIKDQDINISFSEYKDGYTLFAIDLTPDLSADGMRKYFIPMQGKDGETVKLLAPYSVYIGKGVCLEVKDFGKTIPWLHVKSSEKNEVKNRFNLSCGPNSTVLLEGLEHIQQHLKITL